MRIRVQVEAFDPGAELNALHAANVGIGAALGFVGYVRDFNEGQDVAGMFLEHYPGMTEKALAKIAAEAEQRWPLLRLEILHRIGQLQPGEPHHTTLDSMARTSARTILTRLFSSSSASFQECWFRLSTRTATSARSSCRTA